MDPRFARNSLFLLIIVLVAHESGATEMDSGKWSKITVGDHGSHRTGKHYSKGNIILGGSENDEDTNHKKDSSDIPTANSMFKETNVLRLRSMDFQEDSDRRIRDESHNQMDNVPGKMQKGHVHSTHSSSHINHMDPSVIVFFLLADLKLGKTMEIYFPDRDPSSSLHLLPKEEADTIPFSSKELPNLLQLFSFSKGSPQAIAIEDTIRQCEMEPIKGETKFCATSIESMLNFAREIMGLETEIKALSTIHITKLTTKLQKYTITKVPLQISAPKMVACHSMPYPYAVFYCHYQESESRVYRVPLVDENGDKVEAIAVCHMDTSQWSHNHVSFRVLGIEPGTSPVCHFFPADNLVLVPATSTYY